MSVRGPSRVVVMTVTTGLARQPEPQLGRSRLQVRVDPEPQVCPRVWGGSPRRHRWVPENGAQMSKPVFGLNLMLLVDESFNRRAESAVARQAERSCVGS